MERLVFDNKMWISEKPHIWEYLLTIMLGIYCTLQIFMFLMEGFEIHSGVYLFLASAALIWYVRHLKRNGKYVDNQCILSFTEGRLEWEYPCMKIDGRARQIKVLYTITREDISDIALSHEMQSIRLVSRPIMLVKEGKKEKITDFHAKKKNCILVLYYNSIDEVSRLLRKYIGEDIDINIID